jgi:hypothetical protein
MILRALRLCLVVALAGAMLQSLPARADDYTDIWWAGPTEDGWGVNLIQSQDFIFATFFVYGPAPAKTPIWYAGNLTRSGNAFTGGLYQTTGTGIGAPWNVADHTAPRVGTATFTPTSTTTGTLVYNVNTVNETKSIVRQTLTSIAIDGSYAGTAVINLTNCKNGGDNGLIAAFFDPTVSQPTSGQMQLAFKNDVGESCTMSGAFAQEGVLFRIPVATYVCKNGNQTTANTTATVYEMKLTAIALEGRWFASNTSGGCTEDSKFSSVLP